MLKFFVIFFSILTLSSAKEYCIIAFSSSVYKSSDKVLFLRRYPETGTTERYKNIYEYKISPHQSYSDTKATLKKVRKRYKSAYIINCDSQKSSTVVAVKKNGYCIKAFSSSVYKASDKALFLRRYPKTGITQRYKNHYEYIISLHQSYRDTKATLKKVRKHYKSAYIINCDSQKSANVTKIKKNDNKQKTHKEKVATKRMVSPSSAKAVVIEQKKKKVVIPLKNTKVITSDVSTAKEKIPLKNHGILAKKHLSVDASKVVDTHKTPELNEPKILEPFEIPKDYKNDKVQIYDNLTYKRYMDALFSHNDKVDESFYQKKIDSLLVDIRKDVYNVDVYLDGYLRTGRSVPAQGGGVNVNGDYTGSGVAIHADKLLWDGEYNLLNNTYDVLNNRLAQIKEISAKEKLAILGTSIYSSLYTSQEKLIANQKIYEKQLKVNQNIHNSYKNGKISSLVYLDSKNDLLQMKKRIMRLEQEQQHNDYVLRHSIESKSTKIYKLSAPKIELDMDSLSSLEKQALHSSSDVAIESNKLKLKKADLLFQKRRYYPEIRFNSHLGYGVGNLKIFDLNHAGTGEYWELGLQFKMPLYNRNDIRLNEKKELYEVMKQKSVFSQKQRETLVLVDNYYRNIDKIIKMRDIVQEQYDLMSQKLVIAREQFLSGVARYRDYSDANRDYLNFTNQNMNIEEQYLQNLAILSILIGQREFYEKN